VGKVTTYLAGIRDATPIHVEVVPPRAGVGSFRFAAGLAAACGDYLALIDDGTVVTSGWLDALTALLDSQVKPGMVGPMLPDDSPPQRAEGGLDLGPVELGRFAERWRDVHRRRWTTTTQLAVGCVVLRRPAFESVEGGSVGSVAELGAGLIAGGMELAVARDLFVDHAALIPVAPAVASEVPVIPPRLMPKGTMTLPARSPARGYRDFGPGARPRVSLTMIVRDEEANLAPCLESAAGLFEEIVVVDTGSTDRTAEVARSHGARVVSFPWVDDFSAARNAALDHATGRFAFWLDADDRIDEANRGRIRELIAGLDENPAAYVMRQISINREGKGATTTSADHVRLFPLRDDVRWSYRVHEQIVPAIRAAGLAVEWTEIGIGHVGYVDEAVRVGKLERNFRILRAELREKLGDPFVLFNLGWIAIDRGESRTALGYLRASLAASSPRDSIVRKIYVLIARAYRMLGDSDSALRACEAGREFEPDDAELLFREGLLRRERGELDAAESCWRRILEGDRPRQFVSIVADIHGHLTRRHLANLAESRGDLAGAFRLWEEVLLERPGDPEALGARARLGQASRSFAADAGR